MDEYKQVDNQSSDHNPVGRFMVAVGAVIVDKEGKILLIKRSENLDWHGGEWEIMYGRLAQHESPDKGLAREVVEELGLEVVCGAPLRCWHIYRGHEETAQNELIGITFMAKLVRGEVKLSDEHDEYRWVAPIEALELIQVNGIRRDISAYINTLSSS